MNCPMWNSGPGNYGLVSEHNFVLRVMVDMITGSQPLLCMCAKVKECAKNFHSTFSLSPLLINPRRACAARITVVGLSVCRRVSWHYRLRDGLLAIPVASELRKPEKYKGDYPETTAFEIYAVKIAKKANMHNRTGLTVT